MWQGGDEKQSTCHILALTACPQHNTSVTDVICLLLSVAHVIAAEWQSALTHLQHVRSVELGPFSSYLKGKCAAHFLFKCFITAYQECEQDWKHLSYIRPPCLEASDKMLIDWYRSLLLGPGGVDWKLFLLVAELHSIVQHSVLHRSGVVKQRWLNTTQPLVSVWHKFKFQKVCILS